MPITVRVPNILRQYTDDRASVPAEGKTVAEVIAHLEENHPGISQRILDENGSMCRTLHLRQRQRRPLQGEPAHRCAGRRRGVHPPGCGGGCC
ncbi:hypothetical protein SMICM304S_08737 [Streptomyces microflavus]